MAFAVDINGANGPISCALLPAAACWAARQAPSSSCLFPALRLRPAAAQVAAAPCSALPARCWRWLAPC